MAVRNPAVVPAGVVVHSPAGVPEAEVAPAEVVVRSPAAGLEEVEVAPAEVVEVDHAEAVGADTDYPYKEVLLEVIMSLQLIELMYYGVYHREAYESSNP